MNDRHGSFYDLSAGSGSDDVGQSRGLAMADYNRDGKLDLYVVNQAGEPHLLRNATALPQTHGRELIIQPSDLIQRDRLAVLVEKHRNARSSAITDADESPFTYAGEGPAGRKTAESKVSRSRRN